MDEKNLPSQRPVSDYQKGSEHLAAERTFLAWIRTSIAIISLGFVVAKFGVWLRELAERLNPGTPEHRPANSLPIGIGMMVVGAVLALLALWHFHLVNQAVEEGKVRPNRAMVVTVAITIAVLVIVVIIYLLRSTENA